jgi:hypothetical protein
MRIKIEIKTIVIIKIKKKLEIDITQTKVFNYCNLKKNEGKQERSKLFVEL